jgi:hypothetical protein
MSTRPPQSSSMPLSQIFSGRCNIYIEFTYTYVVVSGPVYFHLTLLTVVPTQIVTLSITYMGDTFTKYIFGDKATLHLLVIFFYILYEVTIAIEQ